MRSVRVMPARTCSHPLGASRIASGPPRLLYRLHQEKRVRHYSERTEEAYRAWVVRFVRFCGMRHPSRVGAEEVRAFLSHLAVDGAVASSTQNQAMAALVFLYRDVLNAPMGSFMAIVRAKRPKRLPVVLTRGEVRGVLRAMHGTSHLVAMMLYGSGLRLLECLTLRVKDIDFEHRSVVVRGGKGAKDRVTMLSERVNPLLRAHLADVQQRSHADLTSGGGFVALPDAFVRKQPLAARDWLWQWVFPAGRQYVDPTSGERRRHHVDESVVQSRTHDG